MKLVEPSIEYEFSYIGTSLEVTLAMNIIIIIIIFVFIFLLSFLLQAFMYKRRKGLYKKVGETDTALMFKTDLGGFRFDKVNKRLVILCSSGKSKSVNFDELSCIKYRYKESSAVLFEYIRGFQLWDILPNYRDCFKWYYIVLTTIDGSEIPVFLVGQYEPREPIMLIINYEKKLMSYFGIFSETDDYSRKIYEKIIHDLDSLGIDLRRK